MHKLCSISFSGQSNNIKYFDISHSSIKQANWRQIDILEQNYAGFIINALEISHSYTTPPNWHNYLSSQQRINLALQWRHNGRDSVSNHQPQNCLLNNFFRRRSKKTPKLRVTGLCLGNSPGTGEFNAQMASNAEHVSIWWRHHGDRSGRIESGRKIHTIHVIRSYSEHVFSRMNHSTHIKYLATRYSIRISPLKQIAYGRLTESNLTSNDNIFIVPIHIWHISYMYGSCFR